VSDQPQRLQGQRTRGWRLPNGAVIVDRTSRWGNPYAVRHRLQTRPPGDDHPDAGEPHAGRWEYVVVNLDTGEEIQAHRGRYGDPRFEAHRQAVELYETTTLPHRLGGGLDLAELRGKDLACFCPPELPCHTDVLIAHTNQEDHP